MLHLDKQFDNKDCDDEHEDTDDDWNNWYGSLHIVFPPPHHGKQDEEVGTEGEQAKGEDGIGDHPRYKKVAYISSDPGEEDDVGEDAQEGHAQDCNGKPDVWKPC